MIRALNVTRSGAFVSKFILPKQDVITIGRDANSDLVLASSYVSRRHAELHRAGDGWAIVDTSSNGLQVRGRAVVRLEPFPLSVGDQIVIGDYALLCEAADAAQAAGAGKSISPGPSAAAPAADDGTMRFQTTDRTIITASTPFAYGRASALFRGQGDSSHLCVKLFPKVDQDERRAFHAEVSVQASLKHPNILPVLGAGLHATPAGSPFIVLPFCAGGSVRDLLRERAFYSVDAVMPLLKQLAAAIDFAHESGIIHGDIKPENALLSADRREVFLSDFGMAKVFALKESFSTNVNVMAGGTTAYLSPEQIQGNEQTPLSDIYSFAITAYELLTGQLPFDRTLPPFKQMMLKVSGTIADPLRFNPGLGERARNGLTAALHVHPLKRPLSAIALCDLLASPKSTAPGPASARARTGGPQVFISYSHKDKKWLERIAAHLRPLERDGRLIVWDDRKIEAGSDWRRAIATALSECSCAVLLVSSHFLASDFCAGDELPELLSAASSRGLTIFPVMLSPCHLNGSPGLAALQTVNPPTRTLIELDRGEQERILAGLAETITSLL
ncbi:MAG TPA: protein kinase [Vicinamibacterales bacterium]|nr:protein kinase [Vicinamibacterales bacterium]